MVDLSQQLRVGLDARPLNVAHLRGMGKYVDNLVRSSVMSRVEWIGFSDRPDLPFHRPQSRNFETDVFSTRGHRLRLWEQCALPWRARQLCVNVLHCTATTLPWWQPVPVVVTVHDTIPWTSRDVTDEPYWYLHRLLPRAYRKAAAVITISQSSRRDIVALWPSLESKLHVIPHGIDGRYHESRHLPLGEDVSGLGIRPPYVVYMGGSIGRKRLDWALRVFQRLDPKSCPRLQLVICGVGDAERSLIVGKIDPAIRRRAIVAPFIAEESMPALLGNAIALLYPTLYEGFGFPAIEAQAVGTPVLFSNVGSLAELEGPGARMLPVDDLDAWVMACDQLVKQRAEAPVADPAAIAWSRRFSWDESARRHRDVYESVASLKANH